MTRYKPNSAVTVNHLVRSSVGNKKSEDYMKARIEYNGEPGKNSTKYARKDEHVMNSTSALIVENEHSGMTRKLPANKQVVASKKTIPKINSQYEISHIEPVERIGHIDHIEPIERIHFIEPIKPINRVRNPEFKLHLDCNGDEVEDEDEDDEEDGDDRSKIPTKIKKDKKDNTGVNEKRFNSFNNQRTFKNEKRHNASQYEPPPDIEKSHSILETIS